MARWRTCVAGRSQRAPAHPVVDSRWVCAAWCRPPPSHPPHSPPYVAMRCVCLFVINKGGRNKSIYADTPTRARRRHPQRRRRRSAHHAGHPHPRAASGSPTRPAHVPDGSRQRPTSASHVPQGRPTAPVGRLQHGRRRRRRRRRRRPARPHRGLCRPWPSQGQGFTATAAPQPPRPPARARATRSCTLV